jgi:molybdenum cofactor cytidylyltransferase
METGIIILAAGNSSRLGQPKQLLQFNGLSLLKHTLLEASEASLSPCMVVIGAHKELIRQELENTNALIIENTNWQTGMASGIKIGLSAMLQANKALENIIIAVCDQPFISRQVFKDLQETQKNTGKGIIASQYQSILGTPVLFSKKYFEELQQLTGEEGAKKILKAHSDDLASVAFIKGEIDIDTKTDYLNLQHNQKEGSV